MKKLLIILFLALLTVSVNCGGGSGGSGSSTDGTSLVKITVGSSNIEKTADMLSNKVMSAMAAAGIPSNVYKIVFTISASDMPTIIKEVLVAGQTSITETFSVPNGRDRYILVEAKDIFGNVLFSGFKITDLNGGEVTLIIYLAASDETPPTVISTSPASGATGASITSVITITFSETIDSTTFNSGTFTLRNGESNVAGTIAFDGALVTFTPSANLAYSTTYTGTITTGVKDLAGNPMSEDYSWTFTTGTAPDETPPTVTAVSPGNSATGVAVTSTLTATFSEAMDASTINTTTFMLDSVGNTPVSGEVTYSGTTATFTPSANLAYSTTYTATITTGVKDLAGNPMSENYSWTFTTGTAPDETPPTVPTGLTATAVSTTQINLSWNASTDNVGVEGYKLYRDGAYLKSVATTSTSDTGLSPSTTYCYKVSANDAANNNSAQSVQACATTLSSPPVGNIDLYPSNVVNGTDISFNVRNSGTLGAENFVVVVLYGQTLSYYDACQMFLVSVPAGGSVPLTVTYTYADTYRIIVDVSDIITESDETNNMVCIEPYCSNPPPLSICSGPGPMY
jgi:hypothetical protein